ncbi:hypothetical protein ACMFMG_011548 [Clarireedia jacksonii]
MRWSIVSSLFVAGALPVFSSPSGPVIYGFGKELAVPKVRSADVDVFSSLQDRQVPTLHLGTIPLAVTIPPNDLLIQVDTSIKGTPAVLPDGTSKLSGTLKATCVKCYTTGRAVITTTGIETHSSLLDDVLGLTSHPQEFITNALDLDLEITFEDVSGHFEIDFQFAASGTYTFPLFEPSTPVGGHISDTAEAGLLFSIDLIFTVSGQVDVISGFEVEFPSGSSLVFNPISGELVEENLKGIKVKAIPAKFKSGVACVTVALRYKLKASVSLELHAFGFKFEAGAYIDAPQYKACVTYQPALPCELEFKEDFFIAAAVYVEAVKEINFATWAAGPTAATTLASQSLPSACFVSSKTSKILAPSATSRNITPTPPESESESNTSKKTSSSHLTVTSRKPSATHSTIKPSSLTSHIKVLSSSKRTSAPPFPLVSSSRAPRSSGTGIGTGSLTKSTRSIGSRTTTKRTILPSSPLTGTRPSFTYGHGPSTVGSVGGITKIPSSSGVFSNFTVIPSGTAPGHSYGSGIGTGKPSRKSSTTHSKSTRTRPFPTYGSSLSSNIVKVPSLSSLPSKSRTTRPSGSALYSHSSGILETGKGTTGGIVTIPTSDVLYPNSTVITPSGPPFPTISGSAIDDLYTTITTLPIPNVESESDSGLDSDSTSTSTSTSTNSRTTTVISTSTYTIYSCEIEAIWCPTDKLSAVVLTKTYSEFTTISPTDQTTIPSILPVAYRTSSIDITAPPSAIISTIDSFIPPTAALGTENPPPVSITDEAPFVAVETPIIERIQTITVYTTLGITDIAASLPTAPQVISGSTWYVPGEVITISLPPITSTFSGKGALITPGGGGGAGPYYPIKNSTSIVGTGSGTGVGTGTALPPYLTKTGGTGTGIGTGIGTSSSSVSGGKTLASVSVSASSSPYRPRPDKYWAVVEARGAVKRSDAASVVASAGLFVLALFTVLVVL